MPGHEGDGPVEARARTPPCADDRPLSATPSQAHRPLLGTCVVLVSHGFQPNYERGFANGLAANGAAATLVCSDRTDVSSLLPEIEALNLRGSQDPSRPWWRKAVNLVAYHARLLWLTLRRRRSIVVHVIGLLVPLVWCGLLQGLWFRAFARRYVLTIHNVLPHDRHTWVNLQLHGLAYRLPHSLVVHTWTMRQQLIDEFNLAPERIFVMEHGIEPLGSSAGDLPAVSTAGPLRLLFFGAALRYKGLDILLEALAGEVPEFRLKIAGPCVDAELADQLADSIAVHPRRGAITWVRGFVPEPEVPALFQNSDILILPYRHIDQSGVLFQSFRYGLPVIAADVGSFRRYVGPDVGEIFEPGSSAALGAALRRFSSRRAQFSRTRIRTMACEFEWPRVTEVLSTVYLQNSEAGRA